MPNHLHGIITIVGAPLVGAQPLDVGAQPLDVGAQNRAGTKSRAPTRGAPTVGNVVGAFKSLTTNEYIRGVKSGILPPFNKSIWQRNYYEHIVRDEKDLNRIREYIKNNPQNWKDDNYFISLGIVS